MKPQFGRTPIICTGGWFDSENMTRIIYKDCNIHILISLPFESETILADWSCPEDCCLLSQNSVEKAKDKFII